MNRSHHPAVVASFAWIGLFVSALVGCSDVGDNTGTSEGDASGLDATAFDAAELETGSDAAEPEPDSGAVTGLVEGGSTSDASISAETDATVQSGVDATVDTGTGGVVDAGMAQQQVEAGTDAGPDVGVSSGVDSGIDTGAGTVVDSGVDAGIDSGVAVVADSGADAGIDSGVTVGVDSGGGSTCSATCPASDAVNCPNGPIVGVGSPGCNATEKILNDHSPDCLLCALNNFCLHDNEGDDPSTGAIDCEDVTGNDTANAAVTNTQTCLDLLTCEITSTCGQTGILDCYCGKDVNSVTCKTTQSGACIPQVTAGVDSTDPNFIELNITATSKGNGGSVASKIDNCLFQNCQASCF